MVCRTERAQFLQKNDLVKALSTVSLTNNECLISLHFSAPVFVQPQREILSLKDLTKWEKSQVRYFFSTMASLRTFCFFYPSFLSLWFFNISSVRLIKLFTSYLRCRSWGLPWCENHCFCFGATVSCSALF